MRSDRLLKLADFLETVPRKTFDIAGWQKRPASKAEGKRPGDCGFAGCAVGWAGHAKLFKGFGLLPSGTPQYVTKDGIYSGFGAVDAVFGFTDEWESATKLFYYNSYPPPHDPTPKQVAKRIRKFVKDNAVST